MKVSESKAVSPKRCGPLDECMSGFCSMLLAQGYSQVTLSGKFRVISNFNRWLGAQNMKLCEVDEDMIQIFFGEQPRSGYLRRGDSAVLNALYKYLLDVGMVSRKVDEAVHDDIQRILHDFADYLKNERGLSSSTLKIYLPFISRFLKERFGDGPVFLGEITLRDVTDFVICHTCSRSPKGSKLMISALRSFFRYLRFHGDIVLDLAEAVPTIVARRLSELPKSLEAEDVRCLLDSCDQGTVIGQRDYTILLILSRLGLRPCEIVNMTLDDLDWENGVMIVRGKGMRSHQMPMPQDIGEALVKYIWENRPSCVTRCLFIRCRAPWRGFSTSAAVDDIMRRALKRSGVKSLCQGAYLLRHSLACAMLRQGNSLAEIGEILRHSSMNTTEIYAKVDINSLAALAQPWVGGDL